MKNKKGLIYLLYFCFIIVLFQSAYLYAAENKGTICVLKKQKPGSPKQYLLDRYFFLGETAHFSISARNFGVNAAGLADLTAELNLINPQGLTLVREKKYVWFSGAVEGNEKEVFLDNPLAASFDFHFTSADSLGLYLVGTLIHDNIKQTQFKAINSFLLFDTQESREVIMAPIKSAEQLDNLWSEYFRSKNSFAVMRIMSVLNIKEKSSTTQEMALAATAKFSLERAAREYPDILEICKQAIRWTRNDKKRAKIRKILQEIIDRVEH